MHQYILHLARYRDRLRRGPWPLVICPSDLVATGPAAKHSRATDPCLCDLRLTLASPCVAALQAADYALTGE